MRALILAAGEGTRWNHHLGLPKHFVPVDGEPILHRTVRLFSKHCEVVVIGPDDDRYHIPPAELHVPDLRPGNGDADKFLSSRELWHTRHRTLLVYGDVFFTDEAVDTICAPQKGLRCYARPGASAVTERPYGEIFAFTFQPGQHKVVDAALRYLVELRQLGWLERNGGFELHQVLRRGNVGSEELPTAGLTVIDDWTDDFDYPHYYDRFIELRGAL